MISVRLLSAGLIAFVLGASASTAAFAQDAKAILKAMSDYVGSQQSISLSYDSSIEVITPDIQKVQFDSSGKVQLMRPDKLRASRTGGYADVELTFDGKTLSVLGKNLNSYTQLEASGSTDQLIDRLRHEFSLEMPGADLLLTNSFEALSADILDAKHIGRGVIGGVECEHLAFRNHDTDWQLWVEVGDKPIPRKYVITSKTVAAAPQYTLVISDWSADVAADAFSFKAPEGATEVEITALHNLDEVPHGGQQ